ncbi:MAG: ParB/RepB/Spo0J family partition protein [Alphaproteobacteria bacterium]|nr:ParB/RepB/Spo0J family partition protein [Alphaproteobacteria bacterium]
MTLTHIPLDQLHPSKANVRKVGAKHVDDLVQSIETLGLLQPLLVRPDSDGTPDSFEIIAGQRRYHALSKIAEMGEIEPVPCMVMANHDDAAAIEASLAENIARLPMDEIDQYKAFAALAKEGVDIDDIAARFGVTSRLVKQRLAIANIHPPILTAYRKEQIDASSLRNLTLAPLAKQKEWWALFKDEDGYPPTGHALKRWLLGGGDIPTTHALFDVSDYDGAIITDLFGDAQYFDDASKFWPHQNTAIAALRDRYLINGWQEVTVCDVGAWWSEWEHVKTKKKQGGHVFIQIGHDGEVTCHEGFITKDEAKRREKAASGKADTPIAKPELTKAMQNYLNLHRHAAVRAKLLDHQGLVLRVATAQIIAGSALWKVTADPQKSNTPAIAESLETNTAEATFAEEREAIRQLLGLEEGGNIVASKDDWNVSRSLPSVMATLMELNDETVTRMFTFVVAECLPCGHPLVELLGLTMEVDLAQAHQPDEVFFDLWKDKQAINAAIEEVASKRKAASHISDTAKVQKAVLRNAIKASQPDWTPRYFRFPMEGYTDKGGIPVFDHWSQVALWLDGGDNTELPEAKAA